MKVAILILIVLFGNVSLGQPGEIPVVRTCANVTRIDIAINLLDKECIQKSGDTTNLMNEDENSIEMDSYALCLLKKASIMDDKGKVSLNFDIVKIVRHLYKKTDDKALGLAFVIRSLDKCRSLVGSNPSITATKIMKCLLDNQETILWCGRQ